MITVIIVSQNPHIITAKNTPETKANSRNLLLTIQRKLDAGMAARKNPKARNLQKLDGEITATTIPKARNLQRLDGEIAAITIPKARMPLFLVVINSHGEIAGIIATPRNTIGNQKLLSRSNRGDRNLIQCLETIASLKLTKKRYLLG
jgi:hypothetical protein